MAGPWCPALPVTRAPEVELVPWPAVVLGRGAVYGITHTRSTRKGFRFGGAFVSGRAGWPACDPLRCGAGSSARCLALPLHDRFGEGRVAGMRPDAVRGRHGVRRYRYTSFGIELLAPRPASCRGEVRCLQLFSTLPTPLRS